MAELYEEINVELPVNSAPPSQGGGTSSSAKEEGEQAQNESQQNGESKENQSLVGSSCIIVFPKELRGVRGIVKRHLAEMSTVSTKIILIDSPELKERGLKEGDFIHFYKVGFTDFYGVYDLKTLMRIEFAISNDKVLYNSKGVNEKRVGVISNILPSPQMVLVSSEEENGNIISEYINTNEIVQVILNSQEENKEEEQEEENKEEEQEEEKKEEKKEEEKEEENPTYFVSNTVKLLYLVAKEVYNSYGKSINSFYEYRAIYVLYFWYLYFNAQFKLNAKENFDLLNRLIEADNNIMTYKNQEDSEYKKLVEADELLFEDVSMAVSSTSDVLKSPISSDWVFEIIKVNKQITITQKNNEVLKLVCSKISESSYMILLNNNIILYNAGDLYNSDNEMVLRIANYLTDYIMSTNEYKYQAEGIENTYESCKKIIETFIKTI
jgi:hypothetical protein